MAENRQVNLGDAVRCQLADGTSRYGIVERLRPTASSATGVRVAFPASEMAAAPAHLDCDLDRLQPIASVELRAFLTINIDGPMGFAQQTADAMPMPASKRYSAAAPRRAARS